MKVQDLSETLVQQQQTLVLLAGRISQLSVEVNELKIRNIRQAMAIKHLESLLSVKK
jgi:hypothetical protein